MNTPLTNNRGVALLTTLLALVFMVVITLNFGDVIRRNLSGAAYGMTRIDLQERARSAVNLALSVLFADQQANQYDSLQEPWANDPLLRQLAGQLFDDGDLDLSIEDHTGRLQVNALITPQGGVDAEQRGRFLRLLTSFEIGLSPDEAEHLVDALTDWLDEDDEVTGFGAENSWYRAQSPPYDCRNGPIATIDELLLVRGVSPELLHGGNKHPALAQLLTPYGTTGLVNINTAPPLVLASLADGLDQGTVDGLLSYRADPSHDLALGDWYKEVYGNLELPRTTVHSFYFAVSVRGRLRNVNTQVKAIIYRSALAATPQTPALPPFIISWQAE